MARSFLPAGTDPLTLACARTLIGGLALALITVRTANIRAAAASRRGAGLLAVGACTMACYQGL